jgi:large subunit ribosomal protein L35
MPKMKTSKTAAKRFKKTGKGRLRHEQQNNQHKFEGKSSSRKHRLDRDADVDTTDEKKIKRLLAER